MTRDETGDHTVGTLLPRADALRKAVNRLVDLRAKRSQLQSLATRRDHLAGLVEHAEVLANAATLIRAASEDSVDLRSTLSALKLSSHKLATAVAADLTAITKPNALTSLNAEATFSLAEAALLAIWSRWASGDDGTSGVETVLKHYAPFRATAERIERLREDLRSRASLLPQGSEDVEAVARLRVELAGALSSLAETGLDDEVAAFLRRASSEGVALEDVLASPHLLHWITTNGLSRVFHVRVASTLR